MHSMNNLTLSDVQNHHKVARFLASWLQNPLANVVISDCPPSRPTLHYAGKAHNTAGVAHSIARAIRY